MLPNKIGIQSLNDYRLLARSVGINNDNNNMCNDYFFFLSTSLFLFVVIFFIKSVSRLPFYDFSFVTLCT